jgi:hypothetical protein
MSSAVPEVARQLAAQLAETFEHDRQLAEQQNAAQHRLEAANAKLWSGLHPDALGLLYDDTAAVGAYEGASVIAGQMLEALRSGLPAAEVEAAVLPTLQEAHWTIHRAFGDYQRGCEDRRQLAADVGELIAAFTAELIVAGWSEEQARNADVHQLAAGVGAAR